MVLTLSTRRGKNLKSTEKKQNHRYLRDQNPPSKLAFYLAGPLIWIKKLAANGGDCAIYR
jgi:hypothetical protein